LTICFSVLFKRKSFQYEREVHYIRCGWK
jgi:hypothetical protein